MENIAPPWLDDLGLKKEHLAFCPPGEKPLLWALRTDFLQEDLYLRWASEKYQLPLLSPEFFSFSFDGTLVEKFSSIYDWSPVCYPIYEWENTLFIAALEPVEINSTLKVCTMIAPLSELETGWKKISESSKISSPVTEDALPDLLNLKTPEVTSVHEQEIETPSAQVFSPEGFDFKALAQADHTEIIPQQKVLKNSDPIMDSPQHKNTTSEELPGVNTPPPLPDLDFSTLTSGLDSLKPSSSEEQKPETSTVENTQTVSGAFQNRTTATSTLHVHAHQKAKKDDDEDIPLTDLAFENLSIDQFSLEGDPVVKKETKASENNPNKKPQPVPAAVAKKPTQELGLPSLDDLVELRQEDQPQKPAKPQSFSEPKDEHTELSTVDEESHSLSQSLVSETVDQNDDYTPLPFIVKSDQQQNSKVTTAPSFSDPETKENTQTDHGLPSFVPAGQLISSEDLMSAKEINLCKDTKSIMSFIFNHLKNDYKKLMWIEAHSDGQFYPQYVFGPWHMTTEAWKKPINIDSANIFRIAHLSNLPYHGEIHDNPFNDSYYKLWTRNQKPDFATVAPAYYEDISYGFIVGFSKGPEFEPIGTLKKIENLLSICKNQMIQSPNKIAS